jgi:hypothetical protein
MRGSNCTMACLTARSIDTVSSDDSVTPANAGMP